MPSPNRKNFPSGLNVVEVSAVLRMNDGRIQIAHVDPDAESRTIPWSFPPGDAKVRDYMIAAAGVDTAEPSDRLLESLIGIRLLVNVNAGRNGFMNVTQVRERLSAPKASQTQIDLQTRPFGQAATTSSTLIFNPLFPVKRAKTGAGKAASKLKKGRSRNAR